MRTGIYEIVNKENLKQYVGGAVNITGRWWVHRKALETNGHKNHLLQKDWNEYGQGAFAFGIIEIIPKEKILEREQFWMDAYDVVKTGYNIALVAGSQRGVKRSDETKARIAKARAASTGQVGRT